MTAGDSAGGYLSLHLGLSHPNEIRAVTAAYPLVDAASPHFTEQYIRKSSVYRKHPRKLSWHSQGKLSIARPRDLYHRIQTLSAVPSRLVWFSMVSLAISSLKIIEAFSLCSDSRMGLVFPEVVLSCGMARRIRSFLLREA